MSKNSAKQRMTQLMEWLPTLSSKRNKPVKAKVTQQPNYSKANAYRS